MKKQKRILTAILAVTLITQGMPVGIIETNASEAEQNIEAEEEIYPEETTDIIEDSAEAETGSAELSELSEEAPEEDSASVDADSTDSGEIDSTDGFVSGDSLDNSSSADDISDINDQDVRDSAFSSGTSDASDENSNEESEQFVGDFESETLNMEQEENEITVQDTAGDTLSIKRFRNYEGNVITVKNAKELILLSNCAPEDLKDLHIILYITGESDITKTIKQGDSVSDILKSENETASVSADENLLGEETENSQIDSEAELEASSEEAESDRAVDAETESVDLQDEMQSDDSTQTETVVAARDYTFQGIGTEKVPFEGSITGSSIQLSVDNTFFGGLSSKATIALTSSGSSDGNSNLSLTWCGDGTKPMVAGVYQFDSSVDGGHTLPVEISCGESASGAGSLLGIVKASTKDFQNETLNIGDKVVSYGAKKITASSANAGAICNTLETGTICLKGYAFSSAGCTIESTSKYNNSEESMADSGNAGGLIGAMKSGTTLKIESEVTMPAGSITSSKGNAGGLVGLMMSGAKIQLDNKATLTSPVITGGTSAGGVAGTAYNAIWEGASAKLIISLPTVSGSTATSNAGGFIGYYKLTAPDNENGMESSFPDCVNLTNPQVSTKDQPTDKKYGNSGGYFGLLELAGIVSYKIGGTVENKIVFSPVHQKNNLANAYGAIAGKIIGNNIKSTVSVQNMKITSSYNNDVKYHGGVVGELGFSDNSSNAVYLEIGNVDINVTNPYAHDDGETAGFGGVVGCLADSSILKIQQKVKITTTTNGGDPKIWQGGGIVGCAKAKSVLELSGTTNLSDAQYAGFRSNVGWLVGSQDKALIYAKGDGKGNGWLYRRGDDTRNRTQVVNDIANYGQIIRLCSENTTENTALGLRADLIEINDEHKVVLNKAQSLTWTEADGIKLSSTEDFALLSIAWNSQGNFSAISDINEKNWFKLKNTKIILNADIDLTGTGIVGLSRDTANGSDDVYSGTLDGNGHKITLAIGEPFGYKKDTIDNAGLAGGGVMCATGNYHAAQGLFATTGESTIQNLVIAGNIYVSNIGSAITGGGIAAFTSSDKATIKNVTVEESILADCANNQTVSVGGLYGAESGGKLTLEGDTKVYSTIQLNNGTQTGSYAYAGGVLGQITTDTFKLAVNGLFVGGDSADDVGKITTDATEYAYVGGLVGIIKPRNLNDSTVTENRWMEIRSLTFNNFLIKADKATKVCGGLFGSIWSNVGVYFMTESDTVDGAYTNTKLIVQNSSIDAPKAAGVGGLAYRSSGIWEIRDKGIDIQSMSITAGGDVGLLVCRGEKGTATINGSEAKLGALYLNTTEYWKNSYILAENNISITQTSGVFDEFVAHTTDVASSITDNEKNGVISLATKVQENKRIGVAEQNQSCTTYQNRTAYGKVHQTNACSRYYYDLDQCLEDVKNNLSYNNGQIDTEQELLLWSVYRYAYTNIQKFFEKKGNVQLTDIKSVTVISKDNGTSPLVLDMEKYSYYPININSSITVTNTTFKFYNQQIEEAETKAGNKSTQLGTDSNITQHYTMHCGLFLNQTAGNTIIVSLNTVTFSGSIGKVGGNASGVLFAGNVTGSASDNNLYIANISLKGITFEGLTVNKCGKAYAPLLINSMGSYVKLAADDIKIAENSYEDLKTAAASSLIGNVGGINGKQINLSFLNIVLPDKQYEIEGGGIFSHASLLESFVHDGSSSVATYNFYMGEEWKDNRYTHGVTYGKEITETVEYNGLQLWYYDEINYGENSNRVHTNADDLLNFSSNVYLPYVCEEYKYTGNNCNHEIKVNQRVADILNGCGTYSHPYKITSDREMTILSEYMATGTARTDWRVTITGDQSTYHVGDETYTSSEDKIYQFKNNEWVQVERGEGDEWNDVPDSAGAKITLTNDFMRQYLLNAYYDLQGTVITQGTQSMHQLKLTNFGGFGISTSPFRGVLTSTTNVIIVLSGAGTSNGLIPYSYGSVVKNLTIQYKKTEDDIGKTLTYTDTKDKTSPYYPDVCFGGVIGCVLGGDNIIDNVTVEIADQWLTLNGNKEHLIQVGGYVGSVCGGGVILRNMTKTATGLSGKNIANEEIYAVEKDNDYSFMYVNPYVGRVLDGFVFYEKTVEDLENGTSTAVDSLQNTDKNYYINSLNPTKDSECVTVDSDGAVTVNNATGMLVLSAIINSGAGSQGSSNAYSTEFNAVHESSVDGKIYNLGGKYGKVRNAAYSAIGKNPDATESQLSQADDQIVPGTGCLPYLISKYCGNAENWFNLSSVNISLKKNTSSVDFDMTTFKNGYQGLTGRYASNAIMSGEGVDAGGVVPELFSFNGNGNTLTLNVQVNEYVDDDFHAASVGGVFNLLRVGTSNGTVSNLTIDGTNVSLVYYCADGTSTKDTSNILYKESIGVGGFAGATSSLSATTVNFSTYVEYNNVSVENLTISGPQNAGGLLGSSKNSVKVNKTDRATGIALMLEPNYNTVSVGTKITNSVLDSITVVAPYAVGGFVGYIDNDSTNSLSTKSTDTGTVRAEFIVGNSLTIGKEENIPTYAGGAFGYVKASNLYVNADSKGVAENAVDSVVHGVSINASQYAGGFVGLVEGTCFINDAIVRGESSKKAIIEVVAGKNYLGGIVGYAAGNGKSCKIENSKTVSATLKTTNNINASVDGGTGGIIGRTAATTNSIDSCNVEQTTLTSGKTGGIVGSTSASVTIQNCTVSGNADAKAEITGQQTAGGILGLSTASGAMVSINQCKVSYVKTTSSAWGCGGLLGDVDWNKSLNTLYLFDNAVEHTEVEGRTGDTTAGGFVGDIRGNLTASNLLLNDTIIHSTSENKTGMVIGLTDEKTGKIAVAGLSIQNTTGFFGTELNKDNANAVSQLYGVIKNRDDVKKAIKKKSYFAFADYTGSSLNNKPGENLLGDEAKAPYVVTSPKSSLLVRESTDATAEPKSLYGDGASWSSDDNNNFTVNAEKIWENRSLAKDGHYAYGNIPDGEEEDAVTDFQFSSVISTYKTNQTDSSSTNNLSDFPVVQITAGNADIVKDYLNILTNGGFSAANNQNTSTDTHVSAQTDVYVYRGDKFVKASTTDAAPSFQVTTDSSNKISFSTTTEYDNNRNRFTLLTVTFKEKDADNQSHYYKVLVPILVRRMFEIDFTATLTYGTDFNEADYAGLNSHVLESYGSSITGYLTYTYDSIEGKYAEYGWESYINAGGNVVDSMTKSIRFVTVAEKLPTGMQLTLVDTITGKAYYYTATGKEKRTTAGNSGFDIPLSEFHDSTGATAYKEPSLSELMDITVSSDGENKIFIKVDENGKPDGVEATEGKEFPKPTVKINGEYYRLADSSSGETGEYAISVKEACFKENYYLVITVPQNTSGALNGSIQTTVESKIPHQLHYRKIINDKDDHENSASTYQLSGGYRQQLIETGKDGNVKKISITDSMMTVDVTDTITFPKSQSYLGENDTVKDELYLRFVGGLQKTEENDTSTLQFPRGTSGMANFYVYTETNDTRNYYKYSTDGWIKANNGESAVSYRWTSTGKNMELPLSTDGTTANAISLHQIRDLVKGSETSGDGKFYVQVKLTATFDEDGIEAIPESKTETNGEPSKYVRLTYSSQLSTVSKSLIYSNNRASIVPAATKYYRDQLEIADLTYEADRADQLGINLLDLQEKYLEDGSKENSCIATTADYTLSSMKDLVSTLAGSESIKFSLQLMQKKNAQGAADETNWREDYGSAIINAEEYLGVTVDSKDADSLKYDDKTGTWTWEVKKKKYYDSEQKAIKSDYIFEGNKFRLTQEITLKVNVANVEEKEHFYSNYKVVLTAEVLDTNSARVLGTYQDDNIIYTLAKIAPKFIAPNTSESDTNAGN